MFRFLNALGCANEINLFIFKFFKFYGVDVGDVSVGISEVDDKTGQSNVKHQKTRILGMPMVSLTCKYCGKILHGPFHEPLVICSFLFFGHKSCIFRK